MSNITELIAFHQRKRQAGHADRDPAARPLRRAWTSDGRQRVDSFKEKPKGDGGMINGGFFVLSPKVIDCIEGDSDHLGTRAAGTPGRTRAS